MAKKIQAGRVYAGEAQQERMTKRKQQFLDAGLELFGTVGYRKTTLKMLCAEAGLTDRYFYESFPNMEQLLIDTYLYNWDIIKQHVLDLLTRGINFEEGMEKALDALFSSLEDPRVARLSFLEVLGVSAKVDRIYNDNSTEFAKLILAYKNIERPELHLGLSEEKQLLVAISLVGAISQMITSSLLGEYCWTRQDFIDTTIVLIKGLELSSSK